MALFSLKCPPPPPRLIGPVLEKDGFVRLCGDYKVTVNPELQAEQYPLPRIQDGFVNLAGGQKFSTIDLRQA